MAHRIAGLSGVRRDRASHGAPGRARSRPRGQRQKVRNASFAIPTRGRCRSAAEAGTGRPGPSFLRDHLEYREPQRCGVGPLPPPSHRIGSPHIHLPHPGKKEGRGVEISTETERAFVHTRTHHMFASDHTHQLGSKLTVAFAPLRSRPQGGHSSRRSDLSGRRNKAKCPCGLRSTSESGMSARHPHRILPCPSSNHSL